MSKSWAGGSTTGWRRIRAHVLARDNYQCQIQCEPWGPGPTQRCQGQATCVDHIHGRATTGDDPAHLRAACWPCNRHVAPPAGQAIPTDPKPHRVTTW